MLKKTPLYNAHLELKAKMVDFAGWEMPILYTNQIQEHHTTRKSAGLFDVGHMGLLKISGPTALKTIQHICTNNAEKLDISEIQYSLICNPHGGVMDDVLIYRQKDHFLMVCNSSNYQKVTSWLEQNKDGKTKLEDLRNLYTIIALQGPNSKKIISKLASAATIAKLKHNQIANVKMGTVKAMISRTGYTGEDGFEIYLKHEDAQDIWSSILNAGQKYGIAPCGLAARDTLRIEAALPLYGQEYDEGLTPLEAGYGWAVDLNKDFIGKEAIIKQKEQGITKRLIGIESIDRIIPRYNYRIMPKDSFEIVGIVTSGTLSPTLSKPIGLAYLKKELIERGDPITMEVRRKFIPVKTVKLPFYIREVHK
ncbi:MAG: glycine cleavage system aminomethyltransferase GcvT [bacterium]